MTDPLGQSQVLPYLIGLTQQGYRFHLISCEKAANFAKLQANIAHICAQNNIVWHPLPYTKKPPVLATLWDLQQMKQLARQLQKSENFDAVHCRSYLPALIGLHLKKKYKLKFIFDMRGFWADERIDGKLWNLKNPLYKAIYHYFKRQETAFLENADAIVSLTNAGKCEMEKWGLKKKLPIYIIPCCVDTNLFAPAHVTTTMQQQLRQRLHINPTDFVLGYVGSIGTWYMINEMLDFFKELLLQQPNALFLFVTNEADLVRQKAQEKQIAPEKIIAIAALRNEMPVYISLFHFSIFFIQPSYSKISSSPVKQGELMAMGIPLVANTKVGDNDTLLTSNIGILIAQFNTQHYQTAITQMRNTQFGPADIRREAMQQFDLENGIQKYANLYQHIFS
jgi:glycosyltransferase involved in cell wall biosynthesis